MYSADLNVIFDSFPRWKCNFGHFLSEVWKKNHFFHDFEWLKIVNKSVKHQKMKVHSVKKGIHENRLYHGDFDEKQIFQKKNVQNWFRICGVGDVICISDMCFSSTLMSELSLKKIWADLKNLFDFYYYYYRIEWPL